ncbi:MAG: RluA family pseudouridine synthase [Bdellovibrionota bacterium]
MSRPKLTHTVTSEEAGMRLDRLARKLYAGKPLSWVYRQIRTGGLKASGKKQGQNYRVSEGEVVELPAPKDEKKREAPLPRWEGDEPNFLAEAEGWLAIDKPVGLSVQGGKGTGRQNVVTWLRMKFHGEKYIPAPAHRIDRETSGLILCSKKPSVARRMLQDFKDGRVEKEYLALAQGIIEKPFAVDAPLEKITEGLLRSKVSDKGQPAKTEFVPLASGDELTLLLAKPLTGRTHQIRAHLAYAGHPLAGDQRYGGEEMPEIGLRGGQFFLHAFRLNAPDPDREVERIRLEAPLPEKFWKALEKIGIEWEEIQEKIATEEEN